MELYLRSENSNWGDMHSSTKSSLTFYPDVCACLGAFWYAEAAGDTDLFNRQVAKFDMFFGNEDKSIEPSTSLVTKISRTENNAVGYNIFGAGPLLLLFLAVDAAQRTLKVRALPPKVPRLRKSIV